jgi:hypothetical protein
MLLKLQHLAQLLKGYYILFKILHFVDILEYQESLLLLQQYLLNLEKMLLIFKYYQEVFMGQYICFQNLHFVDRLGYEESLH